LNRSGAYDNFLMESTVGLFKTELIKPRRPWRTLSEVELATAWWVDWYCHRRLHGEIGHIPTEPIDAAMPARSRCSASANDVYCDPASL